MNRITRFFMDQINKIRSLKQELAQEEMELHKLEADISHEVDKKKEQEVRERIETIIQKQQTPED